MRFPFVNKRDMFNIHNINVKLQDNYVDMRLIYLFMKDNYDNRQEIMSTFVLFMSTCDKTMLTFSILKSISYMSKVLSHVFT